MDKVEINNGWKDTDQKERWMQALQIWSTINKKYLAINPDFADHIAKTFISIEATRGKQPLIIILRAINNCIADSLKVY